MTAATANARKNDFVSSTIHPAITGENTPPRLPTKFWIPVHLPAASGPASVWVMAQTLEVNMPSDTQEQMRNPIDNDWFATSAAGSINAAHNSSPVTANVLRTRVAAPPRAIQ